MRGAARGAATPAPPPPPTCVLPVHPTPPASLQTAIVSEGFRSLREGEAVEFFIEVGGWVFRYFQAHPGVSCRAHVQRARAAQRRRACMPCYMWTCGCIMNNFSHCVHACFGGDVRPVGAPPCISRPPPTTTTTVRALP